MAQYASREEVPGHARARYDLILKIESRYLGGGYSSEIAFDPADDRSHSGNASIPGREWTREYEDEPLVRPIPEIMKRPVTGRQLIVDDSFSDWIDGLPPVIWEAIEMQDC